MAQDLDTALLRAFVAVVRAGSMNKAALQQAKTQPALSQQIQRLEQQLGRQLLLRSPRGIRLTAEGERLLPYAERIISLTEQLQAPPALPAKQHYCIGVVEDLVSSHLTRVLMDFAKIHAKLRLSVEVADSITLFASFERQALDVLVCMPVSTAPTPQQELLFPLCWFAAHDFIKQEASLPLVIFSQPCAWRERTLDALNRANIQWHIVFESSSLAALQAAVSAGIGVAALLAQTPPEGCYIIENLPTVPNISLAVYLQQQSRDPISEKIGHLFLQALQQ